MKWCCALFEGLAAFAGQGGLSVVVVSIAGADSFVLQSRGVDVGTVVGHTTFKLYMVEQQAIFHCPGCGRRLHKFYRDSLDMLRREDLNVMVEN